MKKLKKITLIILYCIAIIVAVCSVLSTFQNTKSRFLKILDFPRIQFFIVSLIGLFLFLFIATKKKVYNYIFIVCFALSIIIQGNYLITYTPLVSKTVLSAKEVTFTEDDQISILLVNVKMSNKKKKPLFQAINNTKPDLILLMEIDDWWEKQLDTIDKTHPYSLEVPNDVAYGMVLYSKLPLTNTKVNYLSNKNVPSFESVVRLKNGKDVQLYAIHPVPPTHFEDLPDNEGEKENTMIVLSKKIKNNKLPVLVAGDINDVSWGATDRLTNTKEILHDVRVGRGFYNSYDANNIMMRWPLDHVFVTQEFRLKTLKRLEHIGSDHFPIFTKLVLPKAL